MKKGDRVTKITGDYDFDGVIDSVFLKQGGAPRLVVEDNRGALHIYNEKNLRLIGNMVDHQYLQVLRELLEKGVHREGRNGGTRGLFGKQLRYDLSEGFPLLTTKKLHFKSIAVELLWFLKGSTNIKYLQDHGVTIWNEWADENGNLGPVYGKQWRQWGTWRECEACRGDGLTNDAEPGDIFFHSRKCKECKGLGLETIDQITNVIEGLKRDPYGRRHIVSAWNPAEVDSMALPPCHTMFQFHVANGKLSCQLYQRSADWFLGVPFNIASYALLTHLVAREVGLEAGEFVHTFGDLHLYENHVEQAKEQLTRQPKVLPTVVIEKKSIFDLEWADFSLKDYDPHPAIKASVSA